MNTNEFMKQQYEKYPWAWFAEWFWAGMGRWEDVEFSPGWYRGSRYRLRPIIPDNLPEPPEKAYCTGPDQPGGVYLGRGPLKVPNGVVRMLGWTYHQPYGRWDYAKRGWIPFGDGSHEVEYIIDLSDENANEIIALNRPEAQAEQGDKMFNFDVEESPVAELVQSVLNDRIRYLLSVDERSIRDALIKLGWTPPDPTGLTEESRQCYSVEGLKAFAAKHHPHLLVNEQSDQQPEWVRLNTVDFELQDPPGTRSASWFRADGPEQAFIYALKYGASAVRVRRKE